MADWIHTVRTKSVYEGPKGTMSARKSAEQMARTLLAVNPDKTTGSILRYMQYVINRAGSNMSPEHRGKIKKAMQIIRATRRKT